MNPLSVISSMFSGDSKVMKSLQQAIEIANSGKYTPDLKGALSLAKDYGFNAESFRKMEALSKNPKLIHALGLVAPGAANNLQNMFAQLSSAYLGSAQNSVTSNGTSGLPISGTPVMQTNQSQSKDDFSERMKKLSSF